MTDFVAKAASEIAFRTLIWLIEQIGTSAYVNNAVHAIHARFERRGPRAAVSSALGSLPHAISSRFAVLPQATVDLALESSANLIPALAFSAAFYGVFTSSLMAFAPMVRLFSRWYPSSIAVTICVALIATAAVLFAHYARRVCIAIAEQESLTAALFWIVVSAGGLLSLLLDRPFVNVDLKRVV